MTQAGTVTVSVAEGIMRDVEWMQIGNQASNLALAHYGGAHRPHLGQLSHLVVGSIAFRRWWRDWTSGSEGRHWCRWSQGRDWLARSARRDWRPRSYRR